VSSLGKTIVYGVADVLTLGRGIPRRIDAETIRFPPRFCRYYEADYEPETFRFLRRACRPGETILDIGAHIGLFAVVIGRLVGPTGRVFAFEPTPGTRRVLERTVRLNGCEAWVEVRPEAVSGARGRAEFHDTEDLGSNANSLVATRRHSSSIPVDTIRVDDFVAERGLTVSCLKIDVEGAELGVLEGARATLRRDRPAMSLALHPEAIRASGASLRAIWQLLDDHEYRVARGGAEVQGEWFCRQEDLFDVQCTRREA
jgi:FkbM family methyltransferase